MPKYIRYMGPPNSRFRDSKSDTVWESQGEAKSISADRAKELMEMYPGEFEETTSADADSKSEADANMEKVVTPEGDVRYKDDEGHIRANPDMGVSRVVDEEAVTDNKEDN